MKNIAYILLLSIVLFSSCVRDEILPCPPLTVNITVKDKNYFNVDKVALEEKMSEDLAFKEYVPTLYYQLRSATTGEVIEEQGVFEVKEDGKTFPITFCDCIPHGKYVLTTWGGLKSNTPLGDDPTSIEFHLNHTEGRDIYMTNDTLDYDAWSYDYTVEMERTKGKLIVQVENLPEEVSYSDKTVGGLERYLNSEFQYSDVTYVYTQAAWGTEPEIVTKTVLTPSIQEKGSVVKIDFYDQPEMITPTLTPKDVSVTMKRNELTVLRYVYDDGSGDFTIYILMNDSWDIIYDMDIN